MTALLQPASKMDCKPVNASDYLPNIIDCFEVWKRKMQSPHIPPDLESAAAAVVAPAISASLSRLSGFLTKQVNRATKGTLDRLVVDLRLGFQDYLQSSYERCRTFKTILNPGKPLSILEKYVHVTLSCAGKSIKDDTLIETLNEKRFVVVSGLAGSGKSMFMKYLTICKFERSSTGVPLFVELRRLNDLSGRDLLTFIRISCGAPNKIISKDQFELSLRVGAFILVLDGFDEVSIEFRETTQAQILALRERFPKTSVIVSSRPDDTRFGSWHAFHVYTVNTLSKTQTVKLIKGLDYDPGVKRRFLTEVKKSLYDRHPSFLSSPLLTTIMLLTYEEFAEIPDKMHVFYSQAFDTLYQKHDAQKEQFDRKTHASLTREDFKTCFAAFCAMSYLNQKFSFDDSTLLKTADDAVRYSKQTSDTFGQVTPKQIIDDLRESVCMLQLDGLETTFVHRSFQEYFAAVFVTSMHGPEAKKVLDRYALRYGDSVIAMALDMHRETVEQEWVLPTLLELETKLAFSDPTANTATRFKQMFSSCLVDGLGDFILPAFINVHPEVLGPFEAICRMYPTYLESGLMLGKISVLETVFTRDILLKEEFRGLLNFETFELLFNEPVKSAGRHMRPIEIQSGDAWWLDAAGVGEAFVKAEAAFGLIRRDIHERAKNRTDILDDFFKPKARQPVLRAPKAPA